MRRRSLADELRAAERRDMVRLSPDERVRLALRLGSESLDSFRSRRGLTVDEALRARERQRQARRRSSACLEALLA